MAITDYASLQAAIGDFVDRSDLGSVSTTFISLAEGQINRRLMKDGPVRQMLTRLSVTVNAEYIDLPTDFLGSKAIYLAPNYKPVDFASPEEIVYRKTLYPNESCDPEIYSIVGSQLQFWPWASGTFSGELTYWQRIPALSNSATTNWLLTAYPDIYLYTSLIQSAPYLKDDARMAVWATLAQTGLDDLVEADKLARSAPHLAVGVIAGTTP